MDEAPQRFREINSPGCREEVHVEPHRPSMRGPSAGGTLASIKRLGFTHALSIPDSESRHLHAALEADPDRELIMPCREGESIAIAAGLWVGGAKPLVVLQNTGLMEAGDALRGCGLGPSIPLRLLVGWRGFAGWEAGRRPIDSAFTYTEPVLAAWGIPYEVVRGDADLEAIERMDRLAEATSRPTAVLSALGFEE
jgi:sulfopyruvate decarboxylase TPP-binding subunit